MISMTIMMILFTVISLIFLILNFLFSMNKNNREKKSPFECGFDPMSPSRLPFSIQFYMIGIIFLIFDIEIVIFFPMIPSLLFSNMYDNFNMLSSFIMILMFSLYVEWNDGALMWIK